MKITFIPIRCIYCNSTRICKEGHRYYCSNCFNYLTPDSKGDK